MPCCPRCQCCSDHENVDNFAVCSECGSRCRPLGPQGASP